METTPRQVSVLVVDDEPHAVLSLQMMLSDHGFTVTTFTKSTEAAIAIASTKFDILLLDLSMPVIDGVALAVQARKHDPVAPVVFITGMVDNSDVADRTSGLTNFGVVSKPFDFRELLNLIDKLTGKNNKM